MSHNTHKNENESRFSKNVRFSFVRFFQRILAMNLHFEREPAFSTALWLSESSKFNRHIFFFFAGYLQRIGTTHLKVALFSEVSEISEAPNTQQWAPFPPRKCGERHRRWSAFEAHSKATLLTQHRQLSIFISMLSWSKVVLITALIG